jgi:Tol biopolymer transport system component
MTALVVFLVAPSASRADTLQQDGFRFLGSSQDAKEVFFLSPDRLLPADRDHSGDLYESANHRLSLIATGGAEPGGPEHFSFRHVTPDGSKVFLQTAKPLTATDTDLAIDVYERSPEGLTLISTGPANSNGPELARFQAALPDGSHVVFSTTAALTPDDSDTAVDLYDRAGGTTSLITKGTAQALVAPNHRERGSYGKQSPYAVLSSDGLRVIFATAERLSPADLDDQVDIYEAAGGGVELLSTGPTDNGTCPEVDLVCDAELESSSLDASRIVFATRAALVAEDTDQAHDLYERSNGKTTLLSVGDSSHVLGFPDPEFLAASSDASRVIVGSGLKLTADDRDPYFDIFQLAAGATQLLSGGLLDTSFAGASYPGVEFAGGSTDLSRVFFTTEEGLIPSDLHDDLDLYEHFANRVRLVSGSPRDPEDENSTVSFQGSSANGRTVIFSTEDSLLAKDRGETVDIYARTGSRLTLLTRGFAGRQGGSRVLALSADGKRVVFASDTRLVKQDRDRKPDLYEWFRGRIRVLSGRQPA